MAASRVRFTDKEYALTGTICYDCVFDSMPPFFTTKMLFLLLIVLMPKVLSFSGIYCYILSIFNNLIKFISIFKRLFWQNL